MLLCLCSAWLLNLVCFVSAKFGSFYVFFHIVLIKRHEWKKQRAQLGLENIGISSTIYIYTHLDAASMAASSSLNFVFFFTSLIKLTNPSLSNFPCLK